MRLRQWREPDAEHRETGRMHTFAHWLYEPADGFRTGWYEVKHPLAHRIHLIPGWMMERLCARKERRKR